MPFIDIPSPLIAIVGPTGSGKTRLSIQIAKDIGGEIVSADSRLVYRGMDIGTAKPTQDEMCIVPHHMIDIINPDQPYSLAQYCDQTFAVIDSIHDRGSVPILVGGTGQYFHAIVENWQAPKQGPNSILRRVLAFYADAVGKKELHRKLEMIDPVAAAMIDSSNVRRTIRALEVILLTGYKFSEQRVKGDPRYSTIVLGIHIDRTQLFTLVDARLESMISQGLLEEVRGLMQRFDPHLPAFEAIGYSQIIQHLEGHCSLDEAILEIKKLTHKFIRRQANWFRANDPKIIWIEPGKCCIKDILRIIEKRNNWQVID